MTTAKYLVGTLLAYGQAKMAKILIIMHKAPYPARSDGVTIRLNPIYEYLCARNQVDAVIACDPRPRANARANEARAYCDSLMEFTAPEINPLSRKLKSFSFRINPRRAPYEMARYWSITLARLVKARTQKVKYDAIHWVSSPEAASMYLPLRDSKQTRVTMDWIDSPSLTFERRLRASNHGALSKLAAFRLGNWKKWEASLNKQLDDSMYITNTDASYANPNYTRHIHILPNGILDDIPHDILQIPRDPGTLKIGFLGNMGYEPNIKAALRLYDIFKTLGNDFPNLKLKIIGREPTDAILNLASDRVEVTGPVESIWPDVFDTDVFVFPMTMGAGLQNKVLEALRAGKPVITTSICAAGLVNQGSDAVLTAESDEDFRKNIMYLLNSENERKKHGLKAIEFIKHYDWNTILPRYEQVVLGIHPS